MDEPNVNSFSRTDSSFHLVGVFKLSNRFTWLIMMTSRCSSPTEGWTSHAGRQSIKYFPFNLSSETTQKIEVCAPCRGFFPKSHNIGSIINSFPSAETSRKMSVLTAPVQSYMRIECVVSGQMCVCKSRTWMEGHTLGIGMC